MLVLPVAHRLAGGLLLSTTVVLALRVLVTARPTAIVDARVMRAMGVAR